MKVLSQLSSSRLTALLSALAAFLAWLAFNLHGLVSEQNGFIRFFLGALFAAILLGRAKPEKPQLVLSERALAFSAVVGAILALSGIIFHVHQFEWLGLILLLFGAAAWALPANFTADIALALFLFYWAHPLPGQVFGKLQLAMQGMSVAGAEWLLHILNVRVWADGFALKTGVNTYEVPEWCSGMRTATTVFLLGLGLGLTKRLKWAEIVVVVAAALVQALGLNIIRLTIMVMLTPRVGGEGQGAQFLHDTSGLVVLAAAFLVLVEIVLWERRKRERGAFGRALFRKHEKAYSEHPPFWRAAMEHKWRVAAFALLAVLAAGAAYKSRPYHRAEMMKDVATNLRESGRLEDAQKVADLIGRMEPYDEDWHLIRTRIMVIRQKYEQALIELESIPDGSTETLMEKNVLKAYSYMGLGRMDDAAARVEALPERIRQADPRVAMILAEMGARANDPDEVARNIVLASKWNPNTRRVRAMYPYLRVYRRWREIADSDNRAPYDDAVSAFSATEAYMNLNKTPVVAELALKEMAAWPDDPRALEPLFFMALRREGTVWEERFAAHLMRSAGKMTNPDELHELFGKCFQIARPDLGWFLHRRIGEIDPVHPALSMSVALYGDVWFTFRKQRFGLSAPLPTDKIDMKSFFALGKSFDASWQLCASIPASKELCAGDTVAVRKRYLLRAIAEFKKRDAGGGSPGLSLPMRYLYARALEMADEVDTAAGQLGRIVAERPEEKERARMALSEIYERKGRWPDVYETLRGTADDPAANLTPLLRLCESQLQLRMGLAAIDTALTALRLFPDSTQAASILATALMTYDSPEEALFALSQPRIRRERDLDMLEAECLYVTQRFSELAPYCNSVRLPAIRAPRDAPQSSFLPPAEAALMWHWLSVPTESEFANNAAALKRNLAGGAPSPFLRGMMRLWLDCYEAKGGNGRADPLKWLACGRDATEKAVALNQLTVLLCRQGKFAEARQVAALAASYLPQSATLWRAYIGLSGSDMSVIEKARKACPTDSEIWLAELVAKTRRSEAESPKSGGQQASGERQLELDRRLASEIERAAAAGTMTPAAMTRAGEYLLRSGMRKAASVAARSAVKRARGLLPAYILGVKCAILELDKNWALESARGAIQAALRPPSLFYEKLVQIKADKNAIETDGEMVEALRRLRKDEPDNPVWAQMMGLVRFSHGGWEMVEAFRNMNAALEAGATNRSVYILAAEASRLVGNPNRAVDTLRKGLERHPDDIAMLNNLAYCLCFVPDGAGEALKLAPRLSQGAESNDSIIDTLTLVYLRAGRLTDAEKLVAKTLKGAKENTPRWFRAKLRLAEIALRRDDGDDAAAILTTILKQTRGVSDEDIVAANNLLARASERSETRIPGLDTGARPPLAK